MIFDGLFGKKLEIIIPFSLNLTIWYEKLCIFGEKSYLYLGIEEKGMTDVKNLKLYNKYCLYKKHGIIAIKERNN